MGLRNRGKQMLNYCCRKLCYGGKPTGRESSVCWTCPEVNRLVGTKAAQIPEAPVIVTPHVLNHLSQTGCLGTALKFPASTFTAILGISARLANVLCILDASSAQGDPWTDSS